MFAQVAEVPPQKIYFKVNCLVKRNSRSILPQTHTQTQPQKKHKHKHSYTRQFFTTNNTKTPTQKHKHKLTNTKTQPHKVLQVATPYYKVVFCTTLCKVLLRTRNYCSSTTKYYTVLLQYLQSSTPVLVCATKS